MMMMLLSVNTKKIQSCKSHLEPPVARNEKGSLYAVPNLRVDVLIDAKPFRGEKPPLLRSRYNPYRQVSSRVV